MAHTADPSSKVIVAFIGNGKSTNRYHMPFILNRPDKFCVKWVWEHHENASRWTYLDGRKGGEDRGITYTGDIEQMLQDPEVELVVVCTPVEHYEYTKLALEHNKNVVTEKPFTDTVAQAEKLFSLAREKGVFLSSYQNRRFDSDFLTMQAVIASGRLGRLYEIDEHYDYWRPEVSQQVKPTSKEQSMVYGHGVHTVDQAVSLFGKPTKVRPDVRQLLGPKHLNDYFSIELDYAGADGLPFSYTVNSSYMRAQHRPSFEAYGTRGYFVKPEQDRQEIDLKRFYLPENHDDFGLDSPADYGTLVWYDDDGTYHKEAVPTVRGDYACFYDNVYDVLRNGAEQVVKPEETLEVMRILEHSVEDLDY